MEQDGVEVRPLVQITGEAEFNELFIEEARIPVENVVGGVDNGWRVAITTLMHERAGLAFALQARVQIALGELADELKGTKDPLVRQRFAQIAIEAQVLRLLAYRGLTTAMKSGEPGPGGLAGQVAVGRRQPGADDAGDGHHAARARSSSTTPGPTASCAPARTRSRAGRPRSSRTSSPNASWGCRAHELRPDRGPARDQAHRARLPRRALHAREDPRDRARRPAGPALGRHRRARLAGRGRAGDRRAGGRGRGARLRARARRRWPRTGRRSCCTRSSRAAGPWRCGTPSRPRPDAATMPADRLTGDEDRRAQRRRGRHADRHRRGRQALRRRGERGDDRARTRARHHAAAVHRHASTARPAPSSPATSAAPGTRSR